MQQLTETSGGRVAAHPKKWGPWTWPILYGQARLLDRVQAWQMDKLRDIGLQQLKVWGELLPCGDCRKHFCAMCSELSFVVAAFLQRKQQHLDELALQQDRLELSAPGSNSATATPSHHLINSAISSTDSPKQACTAQSEKKQNAWPNVENFWELVREMEAKVCDRVHPDQPERAAAIRARSNPDGHGHVGDSGSGTVATASAFDGPLDLAWMHETMWMLQLFAFCMPEVMARGGPEEQAWRTLMEGWLRLIPREWRADVNGAEWHQVLASESAFATRAGASRTIYLVRMEALRPAIADAMRPRASLPASYEAAIKQCHDFLNATPAVTPVAPVTSSNTQCATCGNGQTSDGKSGTNAGAALLTPLLSNQLGPSSSQKPTRKNIKPDATLTALTLVPGLLATPPPPLSPLQPNGLGEPAAGLKVEAEAGAGVQAETDARDIQVQLALAGVATALAIIMTVLLVASAATLRRPEKPFVPASPAPFFLVTTG